MREKREKVKTFVQRAYFVRAELLGASNRDNGDARVIYFSPRAWRVIGELLLVVLVIGLCGFVGGPDGLSFIGNVVNYVIGALFFGALVFIWSIGSWMVKRMRSWRRPAGPDYRAAAGRRESIR